MSQGSFVRAKYERDDGVVHSIRLQPETITNWNGEPSGSITGQGSFRATASRRKSGLFARYITIARRVGSDDGPFTGATVQVTVPILQKAVFDNLELNDELTYQGLEWTLVSKQGERIK